MTLIRGTSLLGYVDLVSALGADGRALLRAARIPYGAAGDPEAWIAFNRFVGAVESAAAVTGRDDFGRRLARRQGIEILGPVGTAARTARTVAEGLRSASQYLSVYSPAVATNLTPVENSSPATDSHRLEFRIVTPGIDDAHQTTELAVAIMLKVVRLLTDDRFSPVAVDLPHAALASQSSYLRDYGAAPRFTSPVAAVEISAADLARPVATSDPVHDVVQSYLDSVAAPSHDDLVDQVLRLIRTLLPTARVSVGLVSRQLAMHPRTFQRRLAERGLTFESLVDRGRMELAHSLLIDSDMSLDQLAGVLGYSEQSVLTRACRRWFDSTPSAYRRGAVAAVPRRW